MLTGQIAVVTGAARGIGRAIALELAKRGATVVVNYSGSKEAAEGVVNEIIAMGGNAEAKQCNVADFEATAQFAKEVLDKYGRIDILVNNAGITKDNLLMKMSEADYDAVLDTNLKGAFNMTKHFSRTFLKQRKGKIINISSVSGVLGNAGQANYSASKAGLIGLTKSVARELASRGICVNAVAPGFVETDMTKALQETSREQIIAQIPLGRMGQAEDIAKAVAFLADESGDYITGQVLCVDGGMAI